MRLAFASKLAQFPLLLGVLAIPAHTLAQGVSPETEEDKWTFAVGAYLQAAEIKGVTTVGEKVIPTEVSFDQIIDNLQGAFSIHFQALSTSNVGFAVDYLYAKIGDDGIATPQSGVTIDNVDFAIQNFELYGFFRIGDTDEGAGSLDLIGGARFRDIKNDVTISGLPMPVSGGFGANWWDFIAGGRWLRNVHPRVGLVFRADGGADAYNIQGGVGFRIRRRMFAFVEYKYLKFDHSQGSGADFFAYDASEKGPPFGFGLQF